MKTAIAIAIAAAALIVLALTGCSSDNGHGADNARVAAGSTAEEPAPPVDSATPQAIDTKASTGAGEACDPHNLNDAICLAFHPDAGVVNMTSGARAQEPLQSMTDAQKVALAHDACEILAAGGSAATTTLVTTSLSPDAVAAQIPADINNTNIFMIASLAYCGEFFTEPAEGPSILWTMNAYRDMGEKAALESFAGGSVIQRP